MLHHRDGARFPPDVMLGIQAKEFNLGFIRLENLVSKRAVMCLLLTIGFRLATLPQRPDWWSAAEMVVFLEVWMGSIGFLVTSLTKALLP